jgi:hypothetical protein
MDINEVLLRTFECRKVRRKCKTCRPLKEAVRFSKHGTFLDFEGEDHHLGYGEWNLSMNVEKGTPLVRRSNTVGSKHGDPFERGSQGGRNVDLENKEIELPGMVREEQTKAV